MSALNSAQSALVNTLVAGLIAKIPSSYQPIVAPLTSALQQLSNDELSNVVTQIQDSLASGASPLDALGVVNDLPTSAAVKAALAADAQTMANTTAADAAAVNTIITTVLTVALSALLKAI